MNTRHRFQRPCRTGLVTGFLATTIAFSADRLEVNDKDVDSASLYAPSISRDAPITINVFDASQVDLGNARHHDTAERTASAAPQLLAVDIVESLRDAGFSNVVLGDGGAVNSITELNLHGRFTIIHPAGQAARAWLGFGAGESKVCVDGVVSESSGKQLGYFSHCSKGLGWGERDGQLHKDATRIGQSIANFLSAWADGSIED